MIKKLKIKFILTNMLLITAVMIVAFAFMYLNSAKELETNSINAMRDIALSNRNPIDGLFDHKDGESKTKYPNLSTYTLDIDDRTNTCYIDGFGDVENLTEENIEYINVLINSVQNTGLSEGILEDYNMRFFVTETYFGKRIVLLDKEYEDKSLNQLLVSFSISGVLALIAFLAISMLVARIAVKPVEKSIKQQKQLVSDLSHELKTPITVISTNTDIILSHADSTVDEERKWLGYIKDETKRMTDLISMMLYLAKTDEAEASPKLIDLELSSTAFEASLPFESICFEKGKSFNINIEPDIFIKGEEASIKQLFVILLDNAVKYSNADGRIDLSVCTSGDKAVISVFNTGDPISKDDIPYLFERFYRVDKARSRESGGSGLGLSIAKRIIENNEGNISVTSNAEHGTIFTCTFKTIKNNRKEKNVSKNITFD